MMPSFYQNDGMSHQMSGIGDYFPQNGILYIFFCLIYLCDPSELKSFGLSIESILSRFLGDPRISYISYHVRRSHATILVHAALPIGYSLYLAQALKQVRLLLLNYKETYLFRRICNMQLFLLFLPQHLSLLIISIFHNRQLKNNSLK